MAPIHNLESMQPRARCVEKQFSLCQCAVKAHTHINITKMKTEFISVINFFTVLVFVVSTNAQEFSFGRCPPFPTVTDFDAEKV